MKANKTDQRMTFASPNFGTKLETKKGRLSGASNAAAITRKAKIKKWVKRTVLSLLAIVIVLLLVFGLNFYNAIAKLTGQHNPISLLSTITPQSLKETNGRVNILLAGYSVGDPHHGGAMLTDSIMIISINPKTKAGTIISVPRDLWVNIPGYGQSKINAAYEYGQRGGFNEKSYFPGGMGLLEKVVEQDFGVNFDYYALINYAAFKSAVDAVGGIRIDIQSPDPRGIYDAYTNLKLPNGWVTLNGQEALNLARARGDGPSYGIPNSDFTRTQHQQQMLVALKEKASQMSSLLDPITVVKLVNAVGNNVITDLSVGQIESLYYDTKSIPGNKIKQVTINNYNGQNLITNYYIDGQDALVPAAGTYNYAQIQTAVNSLLSN